MHKYKEGEDYTELTPNDPVVLDAGSPDPQEECQPPHLWDPETETCEYNPDPNSPIIIATGTDSSYRLTAARDGVLFDIDGDGAVEWIAWTTPDAEVAFLAIDRDGDGHITNGKELFGNFTIPGASNGFEALARMARESNGGMKRGSVSSDDPRFARLLLWTDRNHNGVSEPSELRPASELLSDIGLAYEEHKRRDGHGNF
jgi:hypothetical protein